MSEQNLLEGKVAEIVSEKEIAINIGSKDGVKGGMRFAVLSAVPLQIHDPDTGAILGELDRSKVNVRATIVKERFTVCATYKTTTVGNLASSMLLQAIAPPRRETESLRADATSKPQPLPESESYVKIGDRVKQIEEVD